VETITIEQSDSLSISDWEGTTATTGSIQFIRNSNVQDGGYRIALDDGFTQVHTLVVVTDGGGWATHIASDSVARGDYVYTPIVVEGDDLEEAAVTLETEDDSEVEVVGIFYIDSGSIVAELKVARDAYEGMRRLFLKGKHHQHEVFINVVNSNI
jgi:hypothetical protein